MRYIHTIIHSALDDAVRWDRVVRNVADAATPPSGKRKADALWRSPEVDTTYAPRDSSILLTRCLVALDRDIRSDSRWCGDPNQHQDSKGSVRELALCRYAISLTHLGYAQRYLSHLGDLSPILRAETDALREGALASLARSTLLTR